MTCQTFRPGLLLPALALALVGACALAPVPARAADQALGNHLYDKFQVGGSLAGVLVTGGLRIDSKDGSQGTEINMQDDLGYQNDILEPRLSAKWRPGHRHELEASYVFARRSADVRLAKDIQFADTLFTAGLRVKSTFNSDLANLTYRYAFHASETSQYGGALGLGAYFYKVDLEAIASAVVSGGGGDSVTYTSSKSFIAPTASIGLFGRFRAGSRWYINPDARVLYLSIERVHVRVSDLNVGAHYFFKPRLAGEIGYTLNSIHLDVDPKSPDQGNGIVNLGVGAKVNFTTQLLHLGLIYTF
jgi:hypothetical protein